MNKLICRFGKKRKEKNLCNWTIFFLLWKAFHLVQHQKEWKIFSFLLILSQTQLSHPNCLFYVEYLCKPDKHTYTYAYPSRLILDFFWRRIPLRLQIDEQVCSPQGSDTFQLRHIEAKTFFHADLAGKYKRHSLKWTHSDHLFPWAVPPTAPPSISIY